MPLPTDPAELIERVRVGDRRALARAVSIVEDRRPGADELVRLAYTQSRNPTVVGMTGAPGAGKSTIVSELIAHVRQLGSSVAVLAVDPSSPFTGGAILGDRIRMQSHVEDRGVYVRSMSSRGHLGGVADATSQIVALLGACDFDLIIIETVGVGQSETEIVESADTTIVVVTPGWGDGIQAAKAGLLEIADVFAINKSDLPGADEVERDLRLMLELGDTTTWQPPIVKMSALHGDDSEPLWSAVRDHRAWLAAGPQGVERRRRQAELLIRRAATSAIADRVKLSDLPPETVQAVANHSLDPWTAARRLIS